MKRSTAASLLFASLLTSGGAATAQDARSQQAQDERSAGKSPTTETTRSSNRAVMKECVERERAGDSTMSESEARKACQDALRAARDNQDNEPQPPHQQ